MISWNECAFPCANVPASSASRMKARPPCPPGKNFDFSTNTAVSRRAKEIIKFFCRSRQTNARTLVQSALFSGIRHAGGRKRADLLLCRKQPAGAADPAHQRQCLPPRAGKFLSAGRRTRADLVDHPLALGSRAFLPRHPSARRNGIRIRRVWDSMPVKLLH